VGMVATGRKSRCLRPQLYYVALAATPHRVLGCEQHQQPSARKRAAELGAFSGGPRWPRWPPFVVTQQKEFGAEGGGVNHPTQRT